MSRRTGPGGRLRPSPRAHRGAARDPRHPLVQQRDSAFRPTSAAPFDATLEPAGPIGNADDDDRALPDEATMPRLPIESREVPLDAMERLVADEPEPEPEFAAVMTPAGPVREPVPDVAGARPPSAPRPAEARPERPSRPDAGDAEAGPIDPSAPRASCTAPQLRRFIKSRAYVPMHELRRRFAINGEDDDVCAVEVDAHRVYVGLPPAEGKLLGELFRNGEVGYELSMDPETPVVVGVYSMRPISRS